MLSVKNGVAICCGQVLPGGSYTGEEAVVGEVIVKSHTTLLSKTMHLT